MINEARNAIHLTQGYTFPISSPPYLCCVWFDLHSLRTYPDYRSYAHSQMQFERQRLHTHVQRWITSTFNHEVYLNDDSKRHKSNTVSSVWNSEIGSESATSSALRGWCRDETSPNWGCEKFLQLLYLHVMRRGRSRIVWRKAVAGGKLIITCVKRDNDNHHRSTFMMFPVKHLSEEWFYMFYSNYLIRRMTFILIDNSRTPLINRNKSDTIINHAVQVWRGVWQSK